MIASSRLIPFYVIPVMVSAFLSQLLRHCSCYESSSTMAFRGANNEGDDAMKPELTIAMFANYGGHTLPMGPFCSEGIKIALEALKNASVLNSYHLVVKLHDDQMCENGLGVSLVANVLNSATDENNGTLIPFIAGPSCADNAYTGMFLKHYNFTGLTDSSIILDMYTNRRAYSSFYLTTPPIASFYDAIPPFLKSNDWTMVFLLTETFAVWGPMEDTMQYNMARLNISLMGTAKILSFGDDIPTQEHFEAAVSDLAAMDPRVVIVDTHFGSMVACWLHRYNLYGPKYAYVFFGGVYFVPSTMFRPPWCTSHMLAEILQSVVFFFFGNPINLFYDSAVDILGMTGKHFDDLLKKSIADWQQNDKWFGWRSTCYSNVVATAVVLNYTESILRKGNDSLLNWVTSSSKFQQNGSYIQTIFRDFLETFHYKGLNADEDHLIGDITGITGFFQVQFSSEGLAAVPVASYNSKLGYKAKVVLGPGKYVWRTPTGHPPYDALRILPIGDPILGTIAKALLTTFASILLALNIGLLTLTLIKFKVPAVLKSLPILNVMILTGNILVTSFVLILPTDLNPSSHINCTAATLILIIGFSLINAAIFAKLHIAYMFVSHQHKVEKERSLRSAALTLPAAAIQQRGGRVTAISPVPKSAQHDNSKNLSVIVSEKRKTTVTAAAIAVEEISLVKASKYANFGCEVYTMVQALLAAVWIGVEPIKSERVVLSLQTSDNDPGIAYQHFIYQCKLPINSAVSYAFLGTIIGCYVIVVLFSLYLSVFLRKASLIDYAISDVHFFRVASYGVVIIVVAGAAVVVAFFGKEAAMLETSVSVLALIIVFIITSLIFAPKLRHGMFVK